MIERFADLHQPWRTALWTVPLIVVAGSLSGILSNNGFGNPWFDALEKPAFMPPGWVFGFAWTTLYTMLGLALAVVLNAPPSRLRTVALVAFAAQLALNFAWSPIFFAAHDIDAARWVITAMLILAAAAATTFRQVRPLAGWLMFPYLLWLIFAAALTSQVAQLNPGASEPLSLTLTGG